MASDRPSLGLPRPGRLVAVVGTGTEVGKTWVAARLLHTLRAQGVSAAARKLAQSYSPRDDPSTLDAAVLGAAGGEPPETVCPPHRWYPVLMAPPIAAQALGRPGFTLRDLLGELRWPDAAGGVEVGLVETAGGVRSPQADDGDACQVVALLDPAGTLLVADAGLGVINSVLLTIEALLGAFPDGAAPPIRVALNRFDVDSDLHRRNRRWLEDRAGLHTAAMPGEEAALARWLLAPVSHAPGVASPGG